MKCIKNFDRFHIKLDFMINNQYYYSSFLGGCCFLIFLGVAILFVFTTFQAYLHGTSFKIVTMEKSYIPAKKLNVTEHHFTFAMRVTFDNNTSVFDSHLKDFFHITAKTVSKKGNQKAKTIVGIRPCAKSDFYRLKFSKLFNYVPMNSFLCFDTKKDVILEGGYNDPVFNYLDFKVAINRKYMNNFQFVKDIFEKYQFKLSMYYTNPLYDVTKRKMPVFYELASFYTYLDLPLLKRTNMDFQEFVFADDKNLIIENYKEKAYMKLKSATEIPVSIDDRVKSKLHDKFSVAKYFLRAYNKQSTVKRQYMKIPEFLAGAMALLFNLFVIMGIFVYAINYAFARQSIMKRVLKYKDDLAQNESTKNQLVELHNDFPKTESKHEAAPANVNDAPKLDVFTGNDLEDPEREGLKDGKVKEPDRPRNRYLVGCKDIAEKIFCCGCNRKKSELYYKADKKIDHYFDIVSYFKKMHEVDVLKYMLLDENSLKLMNFVSKPGVSHTGINSLKNSPFFNEDKENKFPQPNFPVDLEEIKNSYHALKSKGEKELTQPERNLIQLFEKQVGDIVEISKQAENV